MLVGVDCVHTTHYTFTTMSSSNSATPGVAKRPPEDPTGGDTKRIKQEAEDPQLAGLFDPLPFETKDGISSEDFSLAAGEKFELPDFLADAPADDAVFAGANGHNGSAAASRPSTPGYDTPPARQTRGQAQQAMARANSQSALAAAAPQMLHTLLQQNLTSYPYRTGAAPQGQGQQGQGQGQNTYRPGGAYKPSIRFDPKKAYPAPSNAAGDKAKLDDPLKLNDALAAAGVDIAREEELLTSNYSRTALNLHQQQMANRQRQTYGPLDAFLHPYHVALFMNKTARDNGVVQNFMVDPEILDFVLAACKEWLLGIVGKTAALARHRRRGIPALSTKNGAAGKQKTVPPSQRSEVSKELRNLALRQKELEERRVAKRALLGLEKSDDVAPETSNKAGAEETLHRAANATAAMMTLNPRKKYSWMTSGAGAGGDDTKAAAGKDPGAKQSSLIAARGDNGLRFREIRTGNMITTKDLLGVLEEERMGTSKAIVKGYARLKD